MKKILFENENVVNELNNNKALKILQPIIFFIEKKNVTLYP